MQFLLVRQLELEIAFRQEVPKHSKTVHTVKEYGKEDMDEGCVSRIR